MPKIRELTEVECGQILKSQGESWYVGSSTSIISNSLLACGGRHNVFSSACSIDGPDEANSSESNIKVVPSSLELSQSHMGLNPLKIKDGRPLLSPSDYTNQV
ncbi:hypothetical protein Trydic_g16800 [Trypoxylus dichotomus]